MEVGYEDNGVNGPSTKVSHYCSGCDFLKLNDFGYLGSWPKVALCTLKEEDRHIETLPYTPEWCPILEEHRNSLEDIKAMIRQYEDAPIFADPSISDLEHRALKMLVEHYEQ